tara:strand:+ start:89 stop:433 length:345 start_codon:yes stop_codon:yes gene_type:complete
MAYDATHGFTVQEATNLRVYDSYKCQILTLANTTAKTTASWDTPAKEVVFYTAGTGDDEGITISLKVNGEHGDDIVINHDQLPFTVKGILIEEVTIHGDGTGTDNDPITVLSFH